MICLDAKYCKYEIIILREFSPSQDVPPPHHGLNVRCFKMCTKEFCQYIKSGVPTEMRQFRENVISDYKCVYSQTRCESLQNLILCV